MGTTSYTDQGITFSKLAPENDPMKVEPPYFYYPQSNHLSVGSRPFQENAPSITNDSLIIEIINGAMAIGWTFIDVAEKQDERITFYDQNSNIIYTQDYIPQAPEGKSFLGIISDIPVYKVEIIEASNDNDDIAYDDFIFVNVDSDIEDTEPPVIICPDDRIVSSTGNLTEVIYTTTVTDKVDPNPLVNYNPESGSLFPIGTSEVTITATDFSGNSATCAFKVTVEYNEPSIPDISIQPSSYDFGRVDIGKTKTQLFTITNIGDANLIIKNISVRGPDAAKFSIQSDNCSWKTIAPFGEYTIEVRFLAVSIGNKEATLYIPSNDPDENPFTVQLTSSETEETAIRENEDQNRGGQGCFITIVLMNLK